jgi:hypothetical protein
MSQHDFNITADDANTGIEYRAAVNAALQALAGINSGPTEPTTTYAYQLWLDTSTNKLMIRTADNSSWALFSDFINTSANQTNTRIGYTSLINITTGANNAAIGFQALSAINTGSFNTAIGTQAGSWCKTWPAQPRSNTYSIFVGANTKSSADGCTNEIVIGHDMSGEGSNTTVIGTSETTLTKIPGGNLQIAAPLVPTASTNYLSKKGEIAYDSDYLYICIADNTWKRVALSSW